MARAGREGRRERVNLQGLGKSPLRLVCARTEISKGCWQETLECGHQITTYLEFLWDEKAHLVTWEPNAKRRRCQKCAVAQEKSTNENEKKKEIPKIAPINFWLCA